jgi:hypothetical protein
VRATGLPLGPSIFGRVLALAMAGLLYLAMLAFVLAAGADRRLTAAERLPVLVEIEPVARGDAGRTRAELQLLLLRLRAMPDLVAVTVDTPPGTGWPEPWLASADLPTARLTASFSPAKDGAATRLATLAAALPEGRVRGVADTDAAGEAWAYELRRAGVAIGIVLVLAVAAVAGAAARLTCRHCRNTVEVLIGLGAGVMRVSRAMEGVAVRLTVEATLLAAVALLGSLLLVRRLPALDARLPIAGLHAGELVLLATVPLLAALLGALCARLVTSRQLRAYA